MTGRGLGTGIVAAAMMLATSSNVRANVLLDGGFESGTFDGWTVPAQQDPLFFVSGHAHSGHYAAWFGSIGPVDDTMSQTLATEPGQEYVIDFWLAHGRKDVQNDFSVLWNRSPIMSLVGANAFGYTHHGFVVTALQTSSTITFAGREVLDFFYLDDVRIVASVNGANPVRVATVPEPASLLLLGSGLATAVRARRRR